MITQQIEPMLQTFHKRICIFALLILIPLFMSCGGDDDDNQPMANYDGTASITIHYEEFLEGFYQEINFDNWPKTINLHIYDEEDNQIYFHQWEYKDFQKLVKEVEDTPITLDNIPAGPRQKIIVLLKDGNGKVPARAEIESVSIPVSQKPTSIAIMMEKFYTTLQSPAAESSNTRESLKEFQWEPVPGAQRYTISFFKPSSYQYYLYVAGQDVQDTSASSDYFFQHVEFTAENQNGNQHFFPFPDSAQSKFYNAKEIIANSPVTGSDYYGQDANYSINMPSYSALAYDGNELFTVDNSKLHYKWDAVSVDEYGNEGIPTRQFRFFITPQLIADNITGLTWEIKTVKDSSHHEKDKLFTWQEAQDFINELNQNSFCGFTDWRLPKVHELSSIVSFGEGSDASIKTNIKYFLNTASAPYRSSTLLPYSTPTLPYVSAWYVDFTDGTVNEKNYSTAPMRIRAVRGETITSNLVDNGDNTVTDTTTGLMWTKTVQGHKIWKEALEYCEDLDLIYSDWRLPNRNELHSIVDYNRETSPAIDPIIIDPDTSDLLPFHFWSSTTSTENPAQALTINFQNGLISKNNKTFAQNIMVRAVRNAQ